jgi:signal peptidase II
MLLRRGLLLAVIVVILDVASKLAILEWVMQPPRTIAILPFLALVLVFNRGVSFGILNVDEPWVQWLVGSVAVAVIGGLLWWLKRATNRLVFVGLGLVIGGACGNLIDRLLYGAVVDFVLLHVGDWQWPAFNVADSAISIGVACLLWDSLFGRPKSVK